MTYSRFAVYLMAAVLSLPAFAALDNMPPDEDATRQKIDKLIKGWQTEKRKATLGLIEEAIGLSISYGAPIWNQGDHQACSRFYAKTAKSLCDAFPDESSTESARPSMAALRSALERAGTAGNFDHSAWALRYAFDKNQVAIEMQVARVQSMLQLGDQYFKLSQFIEAQDALQSAVHSLADLDGQALDKIPVECRYAPLALANVFFALKKYPDAVDSVTQGLKYMPQWPTLKADLRSSHQDPEEYEDLVSALEEKAKAQPGDAGLQFLLGYEYYYSGKKKASRELFEKALAIDPKHPAATIFLKALNSEPAPPAAKAPGSI